MLICRTCFAPYPETQPVWRCKCGGLLDLDFNPSFSLKKLAGRAFNLWRYREALPVKSDKHIVSFSEGFTPLLPVAFGTKKAWIKQDQLFPSGSYKDRGTTVLLSKLKELGIRQILEDSSGNAGCSIAAYSARAGISCDIYVPATASPSKLAQIRAYGARLVQIEGSREDTAAAAWRASAKMYYASHCWNPYFFHGTKTFAYEVCEQLNWKAPDTVVLPVGNGTLVIGAWIGFTELFDLGIIKKRPRIIGIQVSACNPVAQAFAARQLEITTAEKKPTIAEGIATSNPIRGNQILECIRESGGSLISVEEAAIAAAFRQMAREGFFIEMTSAAVIAGLTEYLKTAGTKEKVVSLFTGHGLKTADHPLLK